MRQAGILLHISSLPNKYGIGSLGKEAYDFVDFLVKSGQRIWQILPVGPTSYGDSPYQGTSAFALNPYFIDLDLLVEDGLLLEEELPEVVKGKRVDYAHLFNTRYTYLHKAYERSNLVEAEFEEFIKAEDYWLNDYAMYMVLKEEQEFRSWDTWYDDFKYRNPESLRWLQGEYKNRIREWKFYQFLFYTQWMNLKAYANKKGISIMGDMPIYCAYDSSDVWAKPSDFQLGWDLKPTAVAGCPPDAFSEDGQLWGNPLYNYDKMKEENYAWWVARVKHSLKIFDLLRIDHFRGFAGYYSIPFGDTTARNGHWVTGPGYDLFKAIEKACPNANIVAENLGYLTPDVHELLDACGYPGMVIFQFEMGDEKENIPLKGTYPANNIFYSGTHDNQTVYSWYLSLTETQKALIDELCDIKFKDKAHLKIVEFCMNSAADYCIIPLQDYLGLPDDIGRMNIPSTASGNWQYVARKMDFSLDLAKYIKKITKEAQR